MHYVGQDDSGVGACRTVNSILQNSDAPRRCYFCRSTYNVHLHHIFGGTANRKQSEKHGFKVFLCGFHHNMSNEGVHFNRELDLKLKRECQAKFEETHSREEFMKIIGKNYLD